MATKADELYEEDFYAWTRDQATALRRMAGGRWNGPLDLDHLAEEIEDVGSERRDAVRGHVRRIIEHLLKLEYSRSRDSRSGWRASVINARVEIEGKLSRSLRGDLIRQLPSLYGRGRLLAVHGLEAHREAETARDLPGSCPYELSAILDLGWYPPNRHGIVVMVSAGRE
ncbi:MAG: DUF29 domain-containing protein [Geminicoccaceae bacterium]